MCFHQQLKMYGHSFSFFFNLIFFYFLPLLVLLEFAFKKLICGEETHKKKYTYDKHDIKYQLIFICSCTALSQRSVLIIFKVTLNEAVMYESK